VIECEPAARAEVANVAEPDAFSVPVPRLVAPSRNDTVPVGVFVPLAGVTLAIKETLAPDAAVDGPVSTVVVPRSAAALMVIEIAGDVLPEKFASPGYCAVMECTPVVRAVVENVATPEEFSVPVPSAVAPSRNVTMPVGFAVPLAGVIVAVNITLAP